MYSVRISVGLPDIFRWMPSNRSRPPPSKLHLRNFVCLIWCCIISAVEAASLITDEAISHILLTSDNIYFRTALKSVLVTVWDLIEAVRKFCASPVCACPLFPMCKWPSIRPWFNYPSSRLRFQIDISSWNIILMSQAVSGNRSGFVPVFPCQNKKPRLLKYCVQNSVSPSLFNMVHYSIACWKGSDRRQSFVAGTDT
jgi:hypothetical protein